MAFDRTRIGVREQVVHMDPAGDVAVVLGVDRLDFELQGKPMHAAGVRISGVAQRRDGIWSIVQFHGSIPSPG